MENNIPKILELLKEERSFPTEIEEKFIPQLLYEIEILKVKILNTIRSLN